MSLVAYLKLNETLANSSQFYFPGNVIFSAKIDFTFELAIIGLCSGRAEIHRERVLELDILPMRVELTTTSAKN